ncbi:asparagine synthase-related protein (plasmid) [Rhizobium leguminosarum]
MYRSRFMGPLRICAGDGRLQVQKLSFTKKDDALAFNTADIQGESTGASIGVTDQRIVITNAFGSDARVYIHSDEGGISIYSSLSDVMARHRPGISADTLLKDCLGVVEYEFGTLLENVSTLPAGSTVEIHPDGGNIRLIYSADAFSDDVEERDDIAETFEATVESLIRNIEQPIVQLSGGTDSTAILLAARAVKNPKNILAVTWYDPNGSAHQDLQYSQNLCSRLGIRQEVITVDPGLLLSVPNAVELPPRVSTSMAFAEFLNYKFDLLKEKTSAKDICVLNGHGGDHLFFDPLPSSVLIDAFGQNGIAYALRKAREYSRLYSISFPQILGSLFRSVARRQYSNGYPLPFKRDLQMISSIGRGETSSRNNRIPAKEQHIRTIRRAVYENSLSITPQHGVRVRHPFTEGRFLAACSRFPVHELFNEKHTRLPFRESLLRRYNDTAILRSDKGQITSAFQRSLKLKRKWIADLILNGVLARSGFLEEQAILNMIDTSSLGVGGFSSALLRIISAELLALSIYK